MQRHPTLAVPLAAAHVGAAEPARALDPDTLGAGLHGRLHGPLHGAPERDAALQLVGDAAGQQLGIGLGVLHLDDVELDLAVGDLLEGGPQALGFGAAAPDDDARPCGVDVHLDLLVADALDVDAADGAPLQLTLEEIAHLGVGHDVVGVVLVAVPAGLPVRDDAEAKPVGVRLLAHQL